MEVPNTGIPGSLEEKDTPEQINLPVAGNHTKSFDLESAALCPGRRGDNVGQETQIPAKKYR